jgi:release factor glutamine methyltransferase
VQEFFGLSIKVDRRVLIPRPETELLVEAVLALGLPEGATVTDLGTGSGCIPIALGVHRSDLRLHGLDRSADALALAEENAILHRLSERIHLQQGNLASPPGHWKGCVDAVVSNPPYIAEGEWDGLQPEVREYDPRVALVSGPSGLEAYAALAPVARELLRPGGWLVTELGFGQAEGVRELVELAGLNVLEIKPDFHQIPRVLIARKPR